MSKSTSSGGELATSTIVFNKDEKQHCFEINGRNVTVLGGSGKHDHGSSKVKLKNIVDFKWEPKNYPGRLIACHNDGKVIAYAITVNTRQAAEGMVRLVNLQLGQRYLIKRFKGEVLDLQFAHISSQIILGVIEQVALHVHKVEIVSDKIVSELLLKVNDPLDGHSPTCDKISWCPYLPDNGHEDEYASQLLVWSRGDIFQCYSISTVIQHYGVGMEMDGKDISEGGFKLQESLPLITGAIFSADGTTLAVSCQDGVIRFYQVYKHTNDGNPRCLHKWKPHGGKTISSFFFLDNYTDQTLWKHAITCADNNTEIKVWCCETWECTQTIKFVPSIEQPLYFKAEMDPTSAYLVLSDMTTRELYVLQVRKDANLSGNGTSSTLANFTNGKSSDIVEKSVDQSLSSTITSTASTTTGVVSKAFITSIAEFPLSSPILSFGILDVAVRMCKTSDAYLIEELEDYDEENSALYCVVIRMYLVQPKSVQECHLLYQPNVTFGTDVRSTLPSIGSSDYKNTSQTSSSGVTLGKDSNSNDSAGSSENSLTVAEKLVAKVADAELNELKRILSPNVVSAANTSGSSTGHQKVNLMTPDSFNSTSEKPDKLKNEETVNPDVLNTLFMLANVTKQQQQQLKPATGTGSSPEILQDKPSPLSMLNIVNSTMIEEQEQAKVRKSVELQQKTLLETPPVPPMPSAEMLASGGSSPSREVQEILSLKDNDCLNEYYDSDNILLDETDGIGADDDELNDLENDIIDDEEDNEGYNFKNIDDDDDEDAIGQRSAVPQKSTTSQQKPPPEVKPINKEPATTVEKVVKIESKPSIDWPKVPEVPHPPQNNFISSAAAVVQQQPSAPPPPQPPMIVTVPQHSKQLDEVSQKLDRLLDVVQKQSRQITDLNTQLQEQRKARLEDAQRYQTSVNKMEISMRNMIAELINRFEHKNSAALLTTQSQFRQLCDMNQALPPKVVQVLIDRYTHVFVGEISRTLLPIISGNIEKMGAVLKNELAMKTQVNDALLRTSVEKVCRSQGFVDSVGNSVHLGVRKAMEQTYQESLRSIILPSYERTSQELFRQLNMTFSAGTKEYVQKLDQYVSQQKFVSDRTLDLAELIKKVPDQVNNNSDRQYKASTTILREDINRDFKLLQANLLKVMRDNIRHEIEKGLEAQASSLEDSVLSAVRSQAQTPAPSNVDIQEQIRQFLAAGQINKAFHKALLSNDLSLVEFTLEKADYKLVFNPCALEQTVLLSLIQQISADMPTHNELKHRYLSESIVSLNFLDPVTKEHAPKVMRELTQNCQNFLAANPSSALATSIKMLMIAIQGLGLKQF